MLSIALKAEAGSYFCLACFARSFEMICTEPSSRSMYLCEVRNTFRYASYGTYMDDVRYRTCERRYSHPCKRLFEEQCALDIDLGTHRSGMCLMGVSPPGILVSIWHANGLQREIQLRHIDNVIC